MKRYLFFLLLSSSSLSIQAQCWKAIAGGYSHTLAIKDDGTLWATGNGFLVDGTTNSQTHFIQIGTDNKWINVCVSYAHSLGIRSDGTLWSWGELFPVTNLAQLVRLPT